MFNGLFFGCFFTLFFSLLTAPSFASQCNSTKIQSVDSTTGSSFSTRLIGMQTTSVLRPADILLSLDNRFSSVGSNYGGGASAVFGLNSISDFRIGLDAGVLKRLSIGLGFSSRKERLDGGLKMAILRQSVSGKYPVAVTFYTNMAYSAQKAETFFAGRSPDPTFTLKDSYRLSYLTQLLISRSFGDDFYLQLSPSYSHRNYVLATINPENDAVESNDLFSAGIGFQLKVYGQLKLIGDYYYTFSPFRTKNPVTSYYQPLSIGLQYMYAGTFFQLEFSNSSGILENAFIPATTESWKKGGFKFGLSVSKTFSTGGRRTK